jgi:hypothetical protein
VFYALAPPRSLPGADPACIADFIFFAFLARFNIDSLFFAHYVGCTADGNPRQSKGCKMLYLILAAALLMVAHTIWMILTLESSVDRARREARATAEARLDAALSAEHARRAALA